VTQRGGSSAGELVGNGVGTAGCCCCCCCCRWARVAVAAGLVPPALKSREAGELVRGTSRTVASSSASSRGACTGPWVSSNRVQEVLHVCWKHQHQPMRLNQGRSSRPQQRSQLSQKQLAAV
jgi:hypothetical protein